MKECYNINELAMMTGFTTRTLRNHIQQGELSGEKIDGAWAFSLADIEAFFNNPRISRLMSSHRNAAVFDFLADRYKKANRACVILDFAVDAEEADAISGFFCAQISASGEDIQMNYGRDRGLSRVILTGAEESVMDLLKRYYGT